MSLNVDQIFAAVKKKPPKPPAPIAGAKAAPGDLILFKMAGAKTPQTGRVYKVDRFTDRGFPVRFVYHVNHAEQAELAISSDALIRKIHT